MIIWQAGGNGPKTFIHALRINICLPVGMITTRIAADENFDGKWCRPFVIGTSFFALLITPKSR